jgi:hypothetical protein
VRMSYVDVFFKEIAPGLIDLSIITLVCLFNLDRDENGKITRRNKAAIAWMAFMFLYITRARAHAVGMDHYLGYQSIKLPYHAQAEKNFCIYELQSESFDEDMINRNRMKNSFHVQAEINFWKKELELATANGRLTAQQKEEFRKKFEYDRQFAKEGIIFCTEELKKYLMDNVIDTMKNSVIVAFGMFIDGTRSGKISAATTTAFLNLFHQYLPIWGDYWSDIETHCRWIDYHTAIYEWYDWILSKDPDTWTARNDDHRILAPDEIEDSNSYYDY